MKIIKRTVYIILLVLIIFNTRPTEVTGIIPHVATGAALAVVTVVHVALSHRYFAACTKSLFTGKLKPKAVANVIADWLLIALSVATIVTGAVMAVDNRCLALEEKNALETPHGVLAAVMVLLVIAHGVLHIRRRKHRKRGSQRTRQRLRTLTNRAMRRLRPILPHCLTAGASE
jgi:hypothetical protein